MAKIRFIKNSGKTKTINLPFGVGDIVRVKNRGNCYPTYEGAFRHFGIEKHTKHPTSDYSDMELRSNDNTEKQNWVVIDIAMHSIFDDEYLVLIKNSHNEYLVMGINGLESRNKKPLNINHDGKFYQIKNEY